MERDGQIYFNLGWNASSEDIERYLRTEDDPARGRLHEQLHIMAEQEIERERRAGL